MATRLTVHVRLLGFYQMMLGKMYEDVTLEEGSNLDDLWNHFRNSYVQLRDSDMKSIAGMSVNGIYVPRDKWSNFIIGDDSDIDLISQMAGG